MTLTEFLLARIAEDEADAKGSICPCGGPACTIEIGWYHQGELTERLGDGDGDPVRQALHVLRWSPRRVMAECAAKQRIVAAYLDPGASANRDPDYESGLLDALLELVLVYADHPDYDESWRLELWS